MKKTVSLSGVGRVVLAVCVFGFAACTSNVPAPVVGRSGAVATQTAQADTYIVKAGDTFYSIARELGMDPRELIALNVGNVQNPDQLSVGRALRLKPQAAAASGAVTAPVTSDVVVVRPIGDASAAGRQSGAEGNTELLKREPKAGKEPYSEQALALARSEEQQKPGASVPGKPAAAVTGSAGKGAWIWPAEGRVVSTFSKTTNGIDIAGKAGDPVIVTASGKVSYVGTGIQAYGKLVVIRHKDDLSDFLSVYAHNRNILVKEGQAVTQGQKIAEMGDTGADRVKLHFEVRRQGKPVDPLQYLPRR
jgi:lipoprotein NlpD